LASLKYKFYIRTAQKAKKNLKPPDPKLEIIRILAHRTCCLPAETFGNGFRKIIIRPLFHSIPNGNREP
jgi:hypothetical protein